MAEDRTLAVVNNSSSIFIEHSTRECRGVPIRSPRISRRPYQSGIPALYVQQSGQFRVYGKLLASEAIFLNSTVSELLSIRLLPCLFEKATVTLLSPPYRQISHSTLPYLTLLLLSTGPFANENEVELLLASRHVFRIHTSAFRSSLSLKSKCHRQSMDLYPGLR